MTCPRSLLPARGDSDQYPETGVEGYFHRKKDSRMSSIPKKNVVLLGKGDLSIRIADWFLHSENYHLQTVVPVMPEPTWTASLANWSRENGVPVIASGHYKDLPGVSEAGWNVD